MYIATQSILQIQCVCWSDYYSDLVKSFHRAKINAKTYLTIRCGKLDRKLAINMPQKRYFPFVDGFN